MADADKIFFNKIITGHKTWCFAYDSEKNRQSSEWFGETSPRLKKLTFQTSRVKTMLLIFSTLRAQVHKEFAPERKTENAEFYKGAIDRLLKRIQGFVQLRFAL